MKRKAVIIGLFGISGSGKSTILKKLHQQVGDDQFLFLEGSNLVAEEVGGELQRFHELNENGKKECRKRAMKNAGEEAREARKTAVVAGHFMFWSEEEETPPEPVWTETDESTFTHIVYLNVAGDILAQRRNADSKKLRPDLSAKHLKKWQEEEISQLRVICYNAGILFSVVDNPDRLFGLLNDFRVHDERHNLVQAEAALDDIFLPADSRLKRVMVFDGDKTLVNQDTGRMFFDKLLNDEGGLEAPFKNANYSYNAFRQAMLQYEDATDDDVFDEVCTEIAASLSIQPEIESLVRVAELRSDVKIVVITSGLRIVFEKLLERYKRVFAKTKDWNIPHQRHKVIGGGRLSDGYVVTPEIKRILVSRLQDKYNLNVCAFGDSPLDLPMLKQADTAVVVVGDKEFRSRSMELALRSAIETDGLEAQQLLVPATTSPMLDIDILPTILPTEIADKIVCTQSLKVYCQTSSTVTMIMSTALRDANVGGPALRQAHQRVGWWLATKYLSQILGLAEYPIRHVQGHKITGHRVRNEAKTAIVALMRGGEPMALGVNDALPLAMFVHAKEPQDLTAKHLEGFSTVILVDAVINSGKTAVNFVQHVKKVRPSIRIVILAGTVQSDAISSNGSLSKALEDFNRICLVALRVSDNKFTGTKGTDTGNRLFNTTHLD